MLEHSSLTAFLATADAPRARTFYQDVLGLRLLSEDPFALVFDANGTQLRMQKVEHVTPHPFTALGWAVPSIRDAVLELNGRGVAVERYAFVVQDDLGVWVAPSGTKVVWFKDPDGHLLSLSEAPTE